jgi:hypothetical protein
MNWAETSDGPRVYVTGIVTNQSLTTWKDIEFEVRFYNSKGQLVDAGVGYGSLTIGPRNDSGFRVSLKSMVSSNDYGSFRISVANARNARGLF